MKYYHLPGSEIFSQRANISRYPKDFFLDSRCLEERTNLNTLFFWQYRNVVAYIKDFLNMHLSSNLYMVSS